MYGFQLSLTRDRPIQLQRNFDGQGEFCLQRTNAGCHFTALGHEIGPIIFIPLHHHLT